MAAEKAAEARPPPRGLLAPCAYSSLARPGVFSTSHPPYPLLRTLLRTPRSAMHLVPPEGAPPSRRGHLSLLGNARCTWVRTLYLGLELHRVIGR